jgi:2Fe-2S ferredoxin
VRAGASHGPAREPSAVDDPGVRIGDTPGLATGTPDPHHNPGATGSAQTMPKVTFILNDGSVTEVDANLGDSVMQTAINNTVDGIVAECGGCMSCATCHVYIDDTWRERVGAPDANEQAMLELTIDPNENSRLSCQVIVTDELDGLTVTVPAAQF